MEQVYGFFNKIRVRLIKKRILIVRRVKDEIIYLKAVVKKLFKPVYLFPVKLITFSAYYLLKLILRLVLFVLRLVWRCVSWPFRKWSNFFKTIFWTVILSYLLLITVVIIIVIGDNYGSLTKIFCFPSATASDVSKKVARIIGTWEQGSGFFISDDQVLTNFHVINGEVNPKVILPNGRIADVKGLVGDIDADLAILTTKEKYPEYVLSVDPNPVMTEGEPLFSIGYPWGSDIKGKATIAKGKFQSFRLLSVFPVSYIQSDVSIVAGMSGGPLIESCGKVVGINQLGVAGLSMFINSYSIVEKIPGFSDKDIRKDKLDPSLSPKDAVFAFYTYISNRNMEEGFKLLSKKYLEKTNYQEWTSRFSNILNIYITEVSEISGKKDSVQVSFSTATWINEDMISNYYEGTWQTVYEDGVYKMLKSNIKEIESPVF